MTNSLRIIDNLPFVELKIVYNGKELLLSNVLVDTGSGGTILKTDVVRDIGIKPEPEDIIGSIRGIGGKEFVFIKMVDSLELGDLVVHNVEVDIGDMDYGIEINGIIGMDFLLETKAIIDLDELKIHPELFKSENPEKSLETEET